MAARWRQILAAGLAAICLAGCHFHAVTVELPDRQRAAEDGSVVPQAAGQDYLDEIVEELIEK